MRGAGAGAQGPADRVPEGLTALAVATEFADNQQRSTDRRPSAGDLFSPTPLVEAYFDKVTAPKKRLIIIEDAGHFALATHQAEVIAALKSVVR